MRVAKELLAYAFYCHRLPDRSFIVGGHQLPICSRCTGILFGYFIGVFGIILGYHLPVVMLFLLSVPLVVDGIGQHHGRWKSNNCRRFITGISFGFSLILLVKIMAVTGYNQGRTIGFAIKPLLFGGS